MKRGRTQTPEPVTKRVRFEGESPQTEKVLDVFVCGAGAMCELGLGPMGVEVKRPRLNKLLDSQDVGLVQVSAGGAHCLAIDREGRVWSWGQNDCFALGRDTTIELDEDSEDILNYKESAPARVEGLPTNVHFVEVCATDNLSIAITSTGRVYAWGTFIDDGKKSFDGETKFQKKPVLVKGIYGATAVAGGKDHVVILDKKGRVWTWGIGASCQLGIRLRHSLRSRVFGPLRLDLRNIVSVSAGDFQSFAIDADGNAFSWGLNNFGQCGHAEPIGSGAVVDEPTYVEFFEDKPLAQIASGNHHTLWLTQTGEIYTVGETNFHQLGVPNSALPKETVREANGTPSYVPFPIKVSKGVSDDEDCDLPAFKAIACGTDHCIALSKTDGSAWSWGFGEVYQLGHGNAPGEAAAEDEPLPKKIINTATRGVNLTYCGAGGQFTLLTSEATAKAEDKAKVKTKA